MKDIKNIPIIIIFKYCLFFDFFKDGKIPQELANKLNSNIGEKMNLYSNYLTINEYPFLKKIYNEQNCNFNSKYYAIYQFKKDLRTKYFSEACALKLGYNQNYLRDREDYRICRFFRTRSRRTSLTSRRR
jgi:hypothetical protein